MSLKSVVPLLALGLAMSLVACKKPEAAADTASTSANKQAAAQPVGETAAVAGPEAKAAAPAASPFDINTIPVSGQPLPPWPYVALPSGYNFYHADELPSRSKDLARVPVWTGGQLLWVEGKVFSDAVDNAEGKTYSQFEIRKNVQKAVEAMGGVRLTERSFDEGTYKANEKPMDDFRREFDRVRDAYGYDTDADTYVIRRADKAIWVVFQTSDSRGGIMVAEGPLPEAMKQ